MIGVEPGEGALARIGELGERDPPVIVAVGPVEAALLAGALVRRGRLGRRARIGAALGRRRSRRGGRSHALLLGPARPDEEAGSDQQQGRAGARGESENVAPVHTVTGITA